MIDKYIVNLNLFSTNFTCVFAIELCALFPQGQRRWQEWTRQGARRRRRRLWR
jgi:hypothetical protein